MSPNDPYYLNLLIMLTILAIGAGAGYFTGKREGQKASIEAKNDLIQTLKEKVEQLEKKVKQLDEDKEKLQSTIDDLVAIEEARKRIQKNHPSASSPALKHSSVKHSSVAKADAESETSA